MENQRIIEPGAIKINHAIIVATGNRYKDVTNFVANIRIYENLFSPIITGHIALSDAVALADALPLTGEELLLLDIETPGYDDTQVKRVMKCHLYKMEERENLTLHHTVYVLDFMSIEGFTDLNHRISTTYRGKISDTVRKILENTFMVGKPLIIENTVNNEVHTSNYWSPFKNIYYLASKALNQHNNPSFVFFENRDGFIWASLDSLISIEPIQHFVKDQWTRGTDRTESAGMMYQRVLDISTPNMYDYIDRLHNGMFGSSVYTYNIQNKQLTYMVKVANEDYKSVQLNDRLLMDSGLQFNPTSQIKTEFEHPMVYDDSPRNTNDVAIKRNSLLKRIDSLKTNIEVYGRLDYTVGRTIDLTVYKSSEVTKQDDDGDLLDEMLSGRFLITAIAHDITMTKHICSMELCKDSINI